MRITIFATAITCLLWGTVAFAADFDGDGVEDAFDNCSEAANPAQDDTDGDDCGNLCDADYDNSGVVGHPDVFEFGQAFGSNDQEKCHFDPVSGCVVGLDDGAFLHLAFESAPGPSGTTAGTTACP